MSLSKDKLKKSPKPDASARSRVFNALVSNPSTGAGMTETGDTSIARSYKQTSIQSRKRKEEITELFERDAILQQVIQDPINDSLSEWRSTEPDLSKLEKDLKYKRTFMQAGIYARLYGECLIVPILEGENGNKISLLTSLDKAIESGAKIKRLMVLKDYEQDNQVIVDTFSEYHGRPKYYYSANKKQKIHPSRVIPVSGTLTGTSVFNAIEDYLSSFHLGRQDASRAVQEANWIILKTDFEELLKLVDDRNIVEGTDETVYEFIQNRIRELRVNANTNNAYAIDRENEDIVQIDKKNIEAITKAVDQMAQFLSGASNIPMSKLFAKNAGGLSSSSRTDLQNYSTFLKGMRFMVLEPSVDELDLFLSRFNNGLNTAYEWNPLAIESFIEFKEENQNDV